MSELGSGEQSRGDLRSQKETGRWFPRRWRCSHQIPLHTGEEIGGTKRRKKEEIGGTKIRKNPPEKRLQASLPVAGQTECPSLKWSLFKPFPPIPLNTFFCTKYCLFMKYFYEDGTWGTLLCNISLLYWLVKYRFHLVRQLTNLDRASWGTNCICMCGSGGSRPEAWGLTSPHLAYLYMVVFVGNKPARPGVYVPFEDWSFSVSHKRILYSDSSLCTLCSVQPEKWFCQY